MASSATLNRWWTKDTIAVVTGGNKGIGFEIVKQLAQNGLTVVLTARDDQNGLVATHKLKSEGLNVVFHSLDVLSAESISNLASWLQDQFGGFDILFNNAAIGDRDPSFTSVQKVLETNYRAVKVVTKQLLPLLRPSSAGARIVNISSQLGQLAVLKDSALRVEIENPETEEKVDKFVERFLKDVREQRMDGSGWPFHRAYSVSKIALNAYTRVLASSLKDRPDGQHIYVNCATPGHCKTDLSRNLGIYTAEQGAETPVWVGLLPPHGPRGQFFSLKSVLEF